MSNHVHTLLSAFFPNGSGTTSKERWLGLWLLIFIFGEVIQAALSRMRMDVSNLDFALQLIPAGLIAGVLVFTTQSSTATDNSRKLHLHIFSMFIAILMDLIICGFLGFGLVAIVIHTVFISLLVDDNGRFKYMAGVIAMFAITAAFKPLNLEGYNRLLSFLVPSALILFLNTSLGLFVREITTQAHRFSQQLALSQHNNGSLEGDYKSLREKFEKQQIELEQSNLLVNRFEYHLEQVMAERQLVEEALTKSESRFRKMVEDSSDIVLILDAIGQIIYCSDSVQKTLGYTAHDLVGSHLRTHVHPIDLEHDRDQFKAVETWEELGQLTFRMANIHGQWVYLEAISSNMLDQPGISGIVVNLRDITGRKETEKQLKLFESAVANTTDVVMLIEGAQEPLITYVNQAFTKITGHSADEVIGQSPLMLLDPENDSLAKQQFLQALYTHTPIELEQVNLHKNGSLIWVSESLTPIFATDNQFSHWVSIKRDISQRKELEEQFLQSQKMEAVGRLAGGIAHDFNNLLTVILSYSDLMMRQSLEPKQHKYISMIQDASQQASELTQQLLSFSRKQYLERSILNVNEIIREMNRMLGRLIGKNIAIELNLQQGVHLIEANPNQLKQIIMNLAVNARDAMPDGGQIIINTSNIQLYNHYSERIVKLPAGEYVAMTIKDSGTGIDPEILPNIFEPFFTTKADKKGTGLGLSTVYGIITSSGGDIQVHSTKNNGTTFTIYLPKSNQKVELSAAPSTTWGEAKARENETILLVEDNDQVRDLAVNSLRECGYIVLMAPNGSQALELWEQNGPVDLLLTDVMMPKMSGRELATTIIEKQPDISILYMSGYTDTLVTQEDIAENEATFLAKPFTPKQLIYQVREVLDMRRYAVVHS